MAQVRRHYRGREHDARTMLLMIGMGDTIATLVLPYVNFLPRSTDTDSQAIMKLVESIQKTLNSMGCSIAPNGFMGSDTAMCLAQISGPKWYDKTWIQLVGDMITAKEAGFKFPKRGGISMGADEPEESSLKGILLVAGAIAAGVWLTRKG